MSKYFFKTALTIYVLSFFPISCAIAMEDKDQYTYIRAHNIEQQEETCCSHQGLEKCHWGLYHWFSGFKEYLERCQRSFLFEEGNDDRDPDRVYQITREVRKGFYEVQHSSDCYCCSCYGMGNVASNPAMIMCCPVVTLTHILCLPRYCMVRAPNPTTTISETFAEAEQHRWEMEYQMQKYSNMSNDEQQKLNERSNEILHNKISQMRHDRQMQDMQQRQWQYKTH